MTASVTRFPTRATAESLWQRYVELVQQMDADPALRTSIDHNVRIVKAWTAFRDAYVETCEAA